ncbi:MAG: hypothetical protein ACTSUE_09630 [Promethearchaeota archaeon]
MVCAKCDGKACKSCEMVRNQVRREPPRVQRRMRNAPQRTVIELEEGDGTGFYTMIQRRRREEHYPYVLPEPPMFIDDGNGFGNEFGGGFNNTFVNLHPDGVIDENDYLYDFP